MLSIIDKQLDTEEQLSEAHKALDSRPSQERGRVGTGMVKYCGTWFIILPTCECRVLWDEREHVKCVGSNAKKNISFEGGAQYLY